ncbi:MAG: glycerate kinase [Breznakia sp.]
MKVIIASDSYKSCMTSKQANNIIADAIHEVDPQATTVSYTIGDGGEGTCAAFVDAANGRYVDIEVRDAYFRRIVAQYGLVDDDQVAVIEVSSCIGIQHYPRERRHPLYATSYGVGEMLLDAKKRGVKKIILTLGGSATNDGGMGMLQALGVKFYDKNRTYLKSNAQSLKSIAYIDTKQLTSFTGIELIAACDVENTLLGEFGATRMFGKQKGLYKNQIYKVEEGMRNYAKQFANHGIVLDNLVGGGAAGGIGAALQAVLHARLQSGFSSLLAYMDIEKQLQDSDLLITGEGQSDKQTWFGKVPVALIEVANKYNVPTVCISGALGVEYKKLYDKGFIGIYSIADRAMSFEQAIQSAPEKLAACAYTVFKTIYEMKERKK